MASNLTDPSTAEDDDYQVENEDEEDDERTIEEEEQLNSEDEQNELNDLQADANMPLEELLKMYGQNGPLHSNSAQDDEDEEEEEEEYEDEDEETHSSSDVDDRPIPFQQLLHPNGPSLAGEEDDDSDDSSFELEAIKVIRVGDEYQAHVEANVESDSTNEPNDDREVPVDELFWSSSSASDIDNAKIDQYLKSIHEEYPSSDDEISLQTLLKCQFDPVQALLEFRQLPVKTIYAYREWSSDEIQRFEEGLREYRKDFFQISVHKCPDRNVREIVHFYYQWKKSERYEAFLEEQQRLNAITSVTDMIEKFIENQEQQLCTAVGVIPPTNSSSSTTSFLSNEFKRQSANPSISLMALHQQETMKRSLDQVDHESEPSAKKTALNPSNSSTSTTIV